MSCRLMLFVGQGKFREKIFCNVLGMYELLYYLCCLVPFVRTGKFKENVPSCRLIAPRASSYCVSVAEALRQ